MPEQIGEAETQYVAGPKERELVKLWLDHYVDTETLNAISGAFIEARAEIVRATREETIAICTRHKEALLARALKQSDAGYMERALELTSNAWAVAHIADQIRDLIAQEQ